MSMRPTETEILNGEKHVLENSLHDTIARLGQTQDKLAATEKKLKEAESERDSGYSSYMTCRKYLEDAGIPCNFGTSGNPETCGFPRDLADCLQTLIDERNRALAGEANAQRLADLRKENVALHKQIHDLEKKLSTTEQVAIKARCLLQGIGGSGH